MIIDIGKMDKRIEIVKKQLISGKRETLNELGEIVNELGELEQAHLKTIKLWAKVTVMRGSEKPASTGIVTANEYLKVVIRYRKDIDRKCIVRYQNNEYEITSVGELGRKEYLEIICNNEEKG